MTPRRRARRLALLVTGATALAACTASSSPAQERTEQGWALVVGDGNAVACCSGERTDPGGRSYRLDAAYWRDASDDRPSPWYEPGPAPSCLQAGASNRLRLRVLDLPERDGRPATSVVTEVECLGHADLSEDVLEQRSLGVARPREEHPRAR